MRRRLLRGGGGAGGAVHLGQAAYAPMVDMLTILLFFILKSFSMDRPVRPDDADFRLPTSHATEAVVRSTAIDVTVDAIYLEGERTASATWYATHDDELVQELYEDLAGSPPAKASIRADGRVPWTVLRKVIFTAQEAGVRSLDLVAVSAAGL